MAKRKAKNKTFWVTKDPGSCYADLWERRPVWRSNTWDGFYAGSISMIFPIQCVGLTFEEGGPDHIWECCFEDEED